MNDTRQAESTSELLAAVSAKLARVKKENPEQYLVFVENLREIVRALAEK